MRRLFATSVLALAWLCANGAIWDAVQVFAWARMFTGYAQSFPVDVALRETFDPTKPCDICEVVTDAKSSPPAQPSQQIERSLDKLILALDLPASFLPERSSVEFTEVNWTMTEPRSQSVLLPPPRA